jgi:integrase/recombinase XerD
VSGLRDLALIATMFYSFARVSAVLKLKVDDYYYNGARRRLRLHEKGGKEHEMPVHHLLEQILYEYLEAAGLRSGQPLFQSVNSSGTEVTGRTLNRYNAWAAIRKRAKAAGFLTPVGCHTWRATGITIYLENDGRLERAQQMAGHESPRTTKLYDRRKTPEDASNAATVGGEVILLALTTHLMMPWSLWHSGVRHTAIDERRTARR